MGSKYVIWYIWKMMKQEIGERNKKCIKKINKK